MKKYIGIKLVWAMVMCIGILMIVGLPEMMPEQAVPVAAVAPAPVVIITMPNGKKMELPVTEQTAEAYVPPEKPWTDYGDKIVGWIVALAGAWNLIRRPHKPEESPQKK